MKVRLVVVALILSTALHAQIVNMEEQRIVTNTTGWAGELKFGLTTSKEVQQVFNLITENQLQYKTKKDLYLLRLNSKILKTSAKTITDNTFIHFRYNRKFNNLLRLEAFTQWQHNRITGIKRRYLIGAGPRFKVFETKNFNSYIGLLGMYEYELEYSPEANNSPLQVIRSSNYTSFTWRILPNIKLINTTYYQPRPDLLNDYRLFSQASLEFGITKRLSFEFGGWYLFDNVPAPGVPKKTYAIENFLKWKF